MAQLSQDDPSTQLQFGAFPPFTPVETGFSQDPGLSLLMPLEGGPQ